MKDANEYLSQQLGAALERLTFEYDFTWPVYGVAIASNGSIVGIHYRVPGESGQFVAEHVEPPGFAVPINLFFVSSGDGRVANITINGPEKTPEVQDT